NPALDAGLQELRQHLVLPMYMIGNSTVKAFARDWYLKVPDSAVEDGIAYVTVAGANPFFGQVMNVISANSYDIVPGQNPSTFTLFDKTESPVSFLQFGMPGNYSLKGGETRDLTLPVTINDGGVLPFLLQQVPPLVEIANTTGVLQFKYNYYPTVQVGDYPKLTNQDFSSALLYGDMTGVGDPDPYLTLHVGPDFVNLLKYLQRLAAPTPTATPSVVPTTVVPTTVSPVPTVVVPTPSPTVSTSVPVPPTPATTDPVVPPSPVTTSASPSPSPAGPSSVAPAP
ncbi:hypothetical protein CPC16_004388, partial [Podila verticillata]